MSILDFQMDSDVEVEPSKEIDPSWKNKIEIELRRFVEMPPHPKQFIVILELICQDWIKPNQTIDPFSIFFRLKQQHRFRNEEDSKSAWEKAGHFIKNVFLKRKKNLSNQIIKPSKHFKSLLFIVI
jgi:hypothetical protein